MKKVFSFLAVLLVVTMIHGQDIRSDMLELAECDSVVTITGNEKYAIAYKDTLCAIYDNKNHCFVTKLDFISLRLKDQVRTDVGNVLVFWCTTKEGEALLSLCEDNNEYLIFE